MGASGFNKKEPTTLIDKLELVYGCLIGSHTHNYSAQEQLKQIIESLTKKQK